MKGAASYRTAKYNARSITAAIRHDLREKDEHGQIMTKSNEDIDPMRTETANKYWIAGENGGKMLMQSELDALLLDKPRLVQDIIEQKIAEANSELDSNGLRPVLVRQNSVLAVEVVVDVPQSWWDTHSDKDRNAFMNRALQFNDTEFGGFDRRLFVAVHGDEKADRKHLHVFYLPLTPDLRLSAKDVIGGPSEMHRRQERYYNEVAAQFGMPKPDFGSKTKHLTTRAFKEAKKLAKAKAKEILEKAKAKAEEILEKAKAKAEADAAETARRAKEEAIQEAEETVRQMKAEAQKTQAEAQQKYKDATEKLEKIDVYFKEFNDLLPGLIDELKKGREIDKEKYKALFEAKRRMKELEISRTRDFRKIERRLKDLIIGRDKLSQRI